MTVPQVIHGGSQKSVLSDEVEVEAKRSRVAITPRTSISSYIVNRKSNSIKSARNTALT